MATGDDKGAEAKPGAEPPAAGALRRLDDWIGRIETAALVVFMASLVGVGVYQTIAAHFLEINETWPYEVIRYSVFFIAMCGASLAAQRSRMINMDVVTRLLTPKTRAMLRVATSMLVVVICYFFFKAGMEMRDTAAGREEGYDFISPSTGLLALPVGAALIGLHFLLHAVIDTLWLSSGQVPPEPEQGVA